MLEKDKKQPLFEVVYQGTSEAEPDEEGDGSFEMIFDFIYSIYSSTLESFFFQSFVKKL
jgi:hypothetical protein